MVSLDNIEEAKPPLKVVICGTGGGKFTHAHAIISALQSCNKPIVIYDMKPEYVDTIKNPDVLIKQEHLIMSCKEFKAFMDKTPILNKFHK